MSLLKNIAVKLNRIILWMEDYFMYSIKTSENNEYPVDIKKGLCSENPFPDGKCQSELILLNHHKFLVKK